MSFLPLKSHQTTPRYSEGNKNRHHTQYVGGSKMIELNNIRYTGRSFEAAVILPTRNGPLNFNCRVDGPASLEPSQVKRALLGHAVRQRSS